MVALHVVLLSPHRVSGCVRRVFAPERRPRPPPSAAFGGALGQDGPQQGAAGVLRGGRSHVYLLTALTLYTITLLIRQVVNFLPTRIRHLSLRAQMSDVSVPGKEIKLILLQK